MGNNHHNSTKLHETIDIIVKNLCQKHESDNIEQDIIALFEDIIRFFSGREEDFVSFNELTSDQKEELYNEITTIINLLKKLGQEVDNQEAIKILSQGLISSFSKKSRNLAISGKLSKIEEMRLKQEFAMLTIQNIYRENQQKIVKQPSKLKDKELTQISEKISALRNSGVKFTESVKRGKDFSINKSR